MRFDWQRLWPKYWLQNAPTNYEWDAILNDLMDKHEIQRGYCAVKLGKVEVWASNWPYAYGSPYLAGRVKDVLPTVATRKRLRALVGPPDPLEDIRKFLK